MKPSHRTLVHADYCPVNILTDRNPVRSGLGWTNAAVSHPLIDLDRSFACLRLRASLLADLLTPDSIDAWWRGLVTWFETSGPSIEDLAPFFVRTGHPRGGAIADRIHQNPSIDQRYPDRRA